MRLLALLAALALAATGCSDSTAEARPGVLTVGLREPSTLLPADVDDQAGRLVTGALWTPLADYDPTSGKVTMRAAASIGSADRVHWTVKLRPAKFHDGTAVTAQSYVDTWAAIAREQWESSPILTKLLRAKEITAPDPATIALTLDRPSGQVPALLSAPGLVPLPASVLASRDWNGFARAPIGNGPFRLDGPWRPGSGGTLRRAGDASGKASEIDLQVGDPSAQYDDVKAGKLDLLTEVPGDRHEAMAGDFGDRHTTWALPEAGYLAFPAGGRFTDAAVRYGFALGIDRSALEHTLSHQVDPAKALLPPVDAPGERSGTCRPCSFDAAAGKDLLSQASFTGATTIYFGPSAESWTPALAAGLHTSLGIDVTAAPKPASGKPDGPSTIDVELTTESPYELLSALAEATGYTDDVFNQNLAAADAAATSDEAGQLYRLDENQLLRDLPVVPLWSGHGHAVWSTRPHDVTAAPFTGISLATISV